jgi:hypothetical protein
MKYFERFLFTFLCDVQVLLIILQFITVAPAMTDRKSISHQENSVAIAAVAI